jgi:hypothetical protein
MKNPIYKQIATQIKSQAIEKATHIQKYFFTRVGTMKKPRNLSEEHLDLLVVGGQVALRVVALVSVSSTPLKTFNYSCK